MMGSFTTLSRTYRKLRIFGKLGEYLEARLYKNGLVRDGTPQYASSRCENHGGCPYCLSSRTHSSRKREPILEPILEDPLEDQPYGD